MGDAANSLTDAELLRYSRHILLNEIGIDGQNRLLNSHVLIVGAGGLGCAAALYLAASGVGRLSLVDADTIDLTNLQRQIAHTTASIGRAKVDSLREACLALNPEIRVDTYKALATPATLGDWVSSAQVVLDCTDNFATRHAINAACVAHQKPLVSGSAIRFDAQLSVFDASQAKSPCYACVFPPPSDAADAPVDAPIDADCATMGVLSPLVGMVGSMQAAQALLLLTGSGTPLVGKLLLIDARSFGFDTMTLARKAACTMCAQP